MALTQRVELTRPRDLLAAVEFMMTEFTSAKSVDSGDGMANIVFERGDGATGTMWNLPYDLVAAVFDFMEENGWRVRH